ncbi:MAG TPA: UbiA-like polyprenyltransferase [Trueperaceae bacterium]|nr:UbiA-like polyprenyltransferase [Trueperaceae bacterium]
MSTETLRPRPSLGTLLAFVKFEHTLFALPFAYGGMLLAAGGWPGWRTFLLVTLAMLGARTAAMAANRVIDARIDALNPRTTEREIPSGKLTAGQGWLVMGVSLVVLAVAAGLLNALTLALLPVAVVFLIVYPYTKRFTWACHLWLGTTIGAAAAGGYIAVSGQFGLAAWLLWLGVGAWIAGFDIVYAVLDRDFDLEHGVHSIPARFGVPTALAFAASLHVVTVAAFAALPFVTALGLWYWVATGVTAALLAAEHLALRRYDAGTVLAAFNLNMVVGPIMLLGIVLGLL